MVANVFPSRSRRKTLSYELLPVRRGHKSDKRVIGNIDSAGDFDCFEMGGTKEIPWCLRERADATGGQGGSAGDNPKRKLPANARGLVIGIDAGSFDRVRFPVGSLPIKEGRDDPSFAEV